MKFITIVSNVDITVTHGLTNVDKTNHEAKVVNTLNVAPLWTRSAVNIKKGKHLYPVEIADWPTVKALAANDTLTIGQEADEGSEEEEKALAEFTSNKAQISAETAIKRHKKQEAVTGE